MQDEKNCDQLKAENEELKMQLETLDAINKDLQKEIEKMHIPSSPQINPSPISDETFERNGKVYGFAIPGMDHKGEIITADHVIASESLQDELIAMKSGMIKVIM